MPSRKISSEVSPLDPWGTHNTKVKGNNTMMTKIHYITAGVCGLAMVITMFAADEKSFMGCFQWAIIFAGIYLMSKTLLLKK